METENRVTSVLVQKHLRESLNSDLHPESFLHPGNVGNQFVEVLKLMKPKPYERDWDLPLDRRLHTAKALLIQAYVSEIEETFQRFDWEGWNEATETGPSAFY